MNVKFTANMEKELIKKSKKEMLNEGNLRDFYDTLEKKILINTLSL